MAGIRPAGCEVSVVIATRSRPEMAAQALRSVLANGEPPFEVVIVDQCQDRTTVSALGALLDDPRVRYVWTASAGTTRAHNLAIACSQGEIIAITDDDCEVPPNWVAELVAAFHRDERIGVVFGNVVAAPHDSNAGFVPSYTRCEPRLIERLHPRTGIGACMGVRRSAWDALGGFDELLGPGGRFRAANEGDLALRALAGGWAVYETPRVSVVHHGFRSRSEARKLIAAYAYGTGAMVAKHVRCRTPQISRLFVRMGFEWSRGGLHPASRIGNALNRQLRLTAFLRGFLAGRTVPVDTRACVFIDDRFRRSAEPCERSAA